MNIKFKERKPSIDEECNTTTVYIERKVTGSKYGHDTVSRYKNYSTYATIEKKRNKNGIKME